MSVFRFIGRALFASYFIADGWSMVTKPDERAEEVALTTDLAVPRVQAFLPPDTADRIPEDGRSWARIFGIMQLAGGACYATGILRRPGAWLLAASCTPKVVAAWRKDGLSKVFAPLALLGAAVVAAQDTEGKPGLYWRATHSSRRLAKQVSRAGDQLGDEARKSARALKREMRRNAKAARKELAKLAEKAEN